MAQAPGALTTSFSPQTCHRHATTPVEIRIGIVGCSWFAGAAHAPALERIRKAAAHHGFSASVVAVCSRTTESMDRLCRKLKVAHEIRRYDDMHALFADGGIDVVDLVLPTPLMSSAIAAVLAAGKHVISEKPAASNYAAALALHTTLESTRAPSWCGPCRKSCCLSQTHFATHS